MTEGILGAGVRGQLSFLRWAMHEKYHNHNIISTAKYLIRTQPPLLHIIRLKQGSLTIKIGRD